VALDLIWTQKALREIARIATYIAADSPPDAMRVVGRMFARAEGLRDHPRQGRRLQDYRGPFELREVFVHRWRLVYKVTKITVEVTAVIHTSRDAENAPPI
jgi:toxin ParE1/3/4